MNYSLIKILKAFVFWPKFSLTSYRMVNDMMLQGVVPRTVIDIGANVGQFAIASSRIFKPKYIHSFEPLPDCFNELKNNSKNINEIKCYNLALGDDECLIEFHVNKHRHSSSILTLGGAHKVAFPEANEESVIKVEQKKLDSIFHKLEIESPALLKIDVQGYESKVLVGALLSLKKITYIILEASFRELYEGEKLFHELIAQLDAYGFDFIRPVGFLKDPSTNEILQADALFMRRNDENTNS